MTRHQSRSARSLPPNEICRSLCSEHLFPYRRYQRFQLNPPCLRHPGFLSSCGYPIDEQCHLCLRLPEYSLLLGSMPGTTMHHGGLQELVYLSQNGDQQVSRLDAESRMQQEDDLRWVKVHEYTLWSSSRNPRKRLVSLSSISSDDGHMTLIEKPQSRKGRN